MTDLMTLQEAEERWPSDFYSDDSLGGMQREIVRRYWELRAEVLNQVDGEPPQVLVDWLDAAGANIVGSQQRIDELQEQGLKVAFKEMMGYELP